jgi:simple sugar transport system ATP-binding protein
LVGSELPTPETRESTVTDVVALSVAGVSLTGDEGRKLLDDVSFDIHRGEIVGIAGVEGNGQAELVETVLGIRTPAAGTIRLAGDDITAWPTRRRREVGIGYIPEDRHRYGLLLPAPLWENRVLGHQDRLSKGLLIDRAAARADTERIVRDYDVRTPGVDVPAFALSGGNQQKLIVGREMSGDPVVLIASHPTRGVDVGAQAAIWEQLRKARAAGLAVLLISADLEELIGMSDTLLVMLRGRLVAEVDPATVTPEELGSHMTGAAAGAAAGGS